MLTTSLRLVEELGPALASWGERFLVLSENLDHELAIRVRLGLLGPIVLDPLEYSSKIVPVAAFALHAVLALCTAHSSPALQDLYTYLDCLKLLSGSKHQVFTAFSACNIEMAAAARAGSRVNYTRIVLALRKALSALIKADPPVFLGAWTTALFPAPPWPASGLRRLPRPRCRSWHSLRSSCSRAHPWIPRRPPTPT